MRRCYIGFLLILSLIFIRPVQAASVVILSSPSAFQIFQRAGDSGAIVIRGHIENGGEYTVSAAWGGLDSGVLYTGIAADFVALWEGLPAAQHDLIITAADKIITIANVGVGDVYVVGGQSNATGTGEHFQMYMNALGLRAGMFRDSQWRELQDPTRGAGGGGSEWPLLASYILSTGIPVAFIPLSVSGSSITLWQPDKPYFQAIARALDNLPDPYARAMLWQQGEADKAMRAKDYSRYLSILSETLYADYGLPTFAAAIYNNPNVNAGIDMSIRGGSPVLYGADLEDLKPDWGVHYRADEYLQAEAWLWWEALVDAGVY